MALCMMFNKDEQLEKNEQVDIDIPPEMFDFIKVLKQSAASGKYPANNWLLANGTNADKKSNTASMFRHLAEHHNGHLSDSHSGLNPLLHLACRALMAYTRIQRGLKHPND